MDKISTDLEVLGFGKWFQDNITREEFERFDIARVTAVHKDSYVITDGKNDLSAELTGKMLFCADSPMDFPAVGDWVLTTFFEGNTFSIIHKVLPRISLLKRKTAGKKIDYQLIGANIDVAFVVQSLDTNFNLSRLERYLAMVKDGNIEPIVLLSKSDLLDPKAIEAHVNEIHKTMPVIQVHSFSNETQAGLKNVQDLLVSRKTYCLLGSSGVGKTTLLNNLIGETLFTTKAIRERDGKGRHATTYRQLVMLDCGAMLVDTPGMRELGNLSIETGIDATFAEIVALAGQCQFNDCTHVNEKGCAVLKAVESGQLSPKRHQNYLKMKKESMYHEMSYLEKKQKDKQFGKLCKTVMKHKRDRR